ncbi:MAG TPA: hypothetical protein VGE07_13120 [Herpetosiphonaceae bacterium]
MRFRAVMMVLVAFGLAGCGASVSRFSGGPFQEFPVYGAERAPRFDGQRVLSWKAGQRSVAEVAGFYREELGGAGWVVRDGPAPDSGLALIAEPGGGRGGYVISIRQGSAALCADASAIYVSVKYAGAEATGSAGRGHRVSAPQRPLLCDEG